MESTSIKTRKEKLRSEIKEARKNLKSGTQKKWDKAIFKQLRSMQEFIKAKRIFTYVSYPFEPDTLEIIKKLLDEGKEVVIPHVSEEKKVSLTLHLISSLADLEKKVTTTHVTPSSIECALIPGLAFDHKLHRLGFGKGFFDSFLPALDCPKIALAYDFQIVQNVPVEDHDATLTHIVTPTAIFK